MNEIHTIEADAQEQQALLTTDRGREILAFDRELVAVTHKQLIQSHAVSRGNMIRVMPDDIRILPGFNPRIPGPDMDAHIESIAQSIQAEGYYPDKPLAGFAGKEGKKPVIFLTDGEMRYRAALLAIERGADLIDLPLVLKAEGTSQEDLTVALVRSNGGKAFTPLELSIVCARLSKFGWDVQRIADRLGFSSQYVRNLLALAAAPSTVKALVSEGTVPASIAVEAVRAHGEDAPAVLREAVEQARSQGREKVRKTDTARGQMKRVLVQSAPQLLDVVKSVRSHTAFEQLPDDLQLKIRELLDSLNPQPDGDNEATLQASAPVQQS